MLQVLYLTVMFQVMHFEATYLLFILIEFLITLLVNGNIFRSKFPELI